MISGFEIGESWAISLLVVHTPINQELIRARVVEVGTFLSDGFFVC